MKFKTLRAFRIALNLAGEIYLIALSRKTSSAKRGNLVVKLDTFLEKVLLNEALVSKLEMPERELLVKICAMVNTQKADSIALLAKTNHFGKDTNSNSSDTQNS